MLDQIASVFVETDNQTKLFSEEAEAEMNQYSELHSEYADYKQEELPELAQTEQVAVFASSNTSKLPDLLTTSFITNIKVQVETPTLQMCAGNKPVRETVIDNNG